MSGGASTDSVKVVIANAKGDTVTTMNGVGGAGIHHVVWDLRTKRPSPPLSPAARRDSLVNAHKVEHIFDSLTTAHTAPKPALDRLRERLMSGGSLTDLFRSPSAGGRFAERPAEGPVPKKGGGGAPDSAKAAEGAKPGASGDEPALDQETVSAVLDALRAANVLPRDIFGRREPPFAPSGDYLVTLQSGDRKQSQLLRVENLVGENGAVIGSEENALLDP